MMDGSTKRWFRGSVFLVFALIVVLILSLASFAAQFDRLLEGFERENAGECAFEEPNVEEHTGPDGQGLFRLGPLEGCGTYRYHCTGMSLTLTITNFDPHAEEINSVSETCEPIEECESVEAERDRCVTTIDCSIEYAGYDTICSATGLEGPYHVILSSDEGQGENHDFCAWPIGLDLPVEWNRYPHSPIAASELESTWCELSGCGSGDFNAAAGGGEACCSAREVHGEEFTNEDCNKRLIGNTALCYFSTPGSAQSEFLYGSELIGEIVYEPCGAHDGANEDFEYVAISDGRWSRCTSDGFDIAASASGTITITGTAQDDSQQTHQYICVDIAAPQRFSIAECNPFANNPETPQGDLNFGRRDGGINARGGEAVLRSDEQVYFCTAQTSWNTDLDSIALAGTGGAFCNSAEHPPNTYERTLNGADLEAQWTGDLCCGETDDFSGLYPHSLEFDTRNEYYNDDDRGELKGSVSSINNGACFNSVHQPNESFLVISDVDDNFKEVREVMIWHGGFEGCAIDHVAALENKMSQDENLGKIREDVQCALPNDLNKPYDGTFRVNTVPIDRTPFGFGPDEGYNEEGNDFLLSLRDRPNAAQDDDDTDQGQLIHDNEYCNIKNWSNNRAFFCSYREVWEETDPRNPRSHLSFIPWVDAEAQQAECCEASQCWNGTICVDSIRDTLNFDPHVVMNERGDGFVCKDGSWEWTYEKTNWDGAEEGYCFNNTQCLVSLGGDRTLENRFGPNKYPLDEISEVQTPLCIDNGEWFDDHYCQNGTWTSRTKFVALELYNLAGSSDFTLYCDTYDKVLNFVKYPAIVGGAVDFATVEQKYFLPNPSSKCLTFDGEVVPCVNHVCVMVTDPQGADPQIYLGTSLNSRLNRTTTSGDSITPFDFGEAMGSSLSDCGRHERGEDILQSCGGQVRFNGHRSTVIFSRVQQLGSGADFVETLTRLFSTFIETLVSWLTLETRSGFDYTLLDNLADDLYASAGIRGLLIPDFECDNCTDNADNGGDDDNRDEICGDWGNPRKTLDLNTLYLSHVDDRTIFGMAEYEADAALIPIRFNGILYEGFDEDICDTFAPPATITGYKCEEREDGSFIVTAQTITPSLDISTDSLVDIQPFEEWVFLTASTRVQDP